MMMIMFLVFFMVNHPVMMMMMLVLFLLLVGMQMYMSLGNFWCVYMLFMIMISGVLILFLYMISMVPEGKVMFLNLGILGFLMGKVYYEINFGHMFIQMKMWFEDMSLMMVYLVILLFVVMVSVVWMVDKMGGPLRV